MQSFDVAVVGAGPAGSMTAYRLARAGARVLLLDKAKFPRDKPCGGGLTFRAVKELPFSVDPVVEDVVSRVECRLGYSSSFVRGSRDLCLMTQRRRLDAFLVDRAVESGAEFRDGIQVEPDSLDAQVVVGADFMWRSSSGLSYLTIPVTARLLWDITPPDARLRVYGGLGGGVYFINTGFIGGTTQAGLKFVVGADRQQPR